MQTRWTLDYLNSCFDGCDSGMRVVRSESGRQYQVIWDGEEGGDRLVKTYEFSPALYMGDESSLLRVIAAESLGKDWLLFKTLADLVEHDPKTARARALIAAPVLLASVQEEVFFSTFEIEERGNEMRLKEDWACG